MSEIQRPPQKIGAIVFERRVYSGPLGDGFTDFEFRAVGPNLEMKRNHVGPEVRPSHDFQVVPDFSMLERQITGTVTENLDVVKFVEAPPGSGNFVRTVVQETHQVPVFADVAVVIKHPYKGQFFGL